MASGDDSRLRSLPAVHELAASLDAPHGLAVTAARRAIDERRVALLSGADPEGADLSDRARALIEELEAPSLRPVLNATGVILHTNLGRAPLAPAARDAVTRAAGGYGNLELDLATGARGSRQAHVESLLRELTGASAALAVNNGAGAVLLAVAALAGPGRGIVVSRGQLVEIGGGFRIPEVIAQSGVEDDRGRDHQPHPPGRLPPRARRLRRRRRSRGDRNPARTPLELPHRRLRRGGVDRGAVRARGTGDRRRRLRRPGRCRRNPGAGRRARAEALDRGGRRLGLLLGRQAARRPPGRAAARNRRRRDRGPGAPAGPGAADRQALAGRARGDPGAVPGSRAWPAARFPCWPCSTPASRPWPPARAICKA